MKLSFVAALALAAIVPVWAQTTPGPEVGAHLPSQAAADALKEFAQTDVAFLAAGLVKDPFDKADLSSLLQYPTDEVLVLNLTGAQIRLALERSIALYPQPNASFLQLSGLEVTFKKDAMPENRIVSVTVGGVQLDNGKSYQVAMPSSLGRGGLGFFKIWDKGKIVKTIAGSTMESALKGKKYMETTPRWVAQ